MCVCVCVCVCAYRTVLFTYTGVLCVSVCVFVCVRTEQSYSHTQECYVSVYSPVLSTDTGVLCLCVCVWRWQLEIRRKVSKGYKESTKGTTMRAFTLPPQAP